MTRESIQEHNSPRPAAVRWTIAGAALLIATAGYVHLCLYRRGYRFIPTVGPAFILDAAASFAVATILIGTALRGAAHSHSLLARLWSRIGALGLLTASLVAFAISRTPSGLFGFYERGFDPAPKAAVAFFSEVAALVLVAVSLVAERSKNRKRASESRLTLAGAAG